MTFSWYEMVSSLERLGYEIREEIIEHEIHHNGLQTEVAKYKCYQVYYRGQLMTGEGFEGRYGPQRVEAVFRDELKKRMLNLFKS